MKIEISRILERDREGDNREDAKKKKKKKRKRTNFFLASKILECILSRSFLHRFRFGISRSAVLGMIPRALSPGCELRGWNLRPRLLHRVTDSLEKYAVTNANAVSTTTDDRLRRYFRFQSSTKSPKTYQSCCGIPQFFFFSWFFFVQ